MSHTKPPILWPQALMFAITFAVAVIAVPWYGLLHGYHWGLWIAVLVVLAANGLSITAGYHRLWAHNAYKAHPALRLFFALFGASALQNSILIWASGHRRHHRHVDDDERDPYSAGRGLWFSHIGWMLRDYPASQDDFSNARDLQRDRIVMWQHRHYLPIALTMNIVPAVLIGLLLGDVIAGILLVGFLRLVINHHVTFFINSLAHWWGRQPYTDENSARDNDLLALLTYGEGYHNYHHIFQYDYRNGVRWWQFDPTKWLIKTCSWLGLTWDLKTVPDFKIQHARVTMQFRRAEQRLAAHGEASVSQQVRDFLEAEYQQLRQYLQEWNEISQHWYGQKRQALTEQRAALQHSLWEKWEHTAARTRLKELEYALKMQRKRLELLTLQLTQAAAQPAR